MFRIITQFIPSPRLFLLCDNQNCGASADAPLNRTVDPSQAQSDFLTDAQSAGWSVALLGQLCPRHTEQARQQMAAAVAAAEEKRNGSGLVSISRGPLVGANGKPV
jgi:hypothetical protein